MTKTNFQKYAGIALASTVVIGGIASAAITPIPVISNTFAVAGQVIKSADINKLAEALNILDARTNGTAPTDPNHLADKEYVDALFTSSQGLGTGQTYQNVLANRAFFTTYTNDTGKPIYVWVDQFLDVGESPSGASFNVNGAPILYDDALGQAGSNHISLSAIVPNGATYSVDGGAGTTINTWIELR